MKKCSSLNIIIAICTILIVLLCVGAFVYKPHFSNSLSGNNADWGNFGDFFWGLGTMLLTALNVYVFYKLTISIGESEKDRDEAALKLQQRQFEFNQKMAILNDLRSAILELHTKHKISEELRTDIYGVLNRIQVLRNLFSSDELAAKVIDLRNKVLSYDSETVDAWLEQNSKGEKIYIPIDKRVIEILKGLSDISTIIWQDLDNQFNNKS